MGSMTDDQIRRSNGRAWAVRLPNLLATRNGRLASFFLLYVTEGIPLGFAATAIAYYLRKFGVGPAEIGAFVGSLYVPWAFKWSFGPLVDVFRSQRYGHRRAWIIGTQLAMAVTLVGLVLVKLPDHLALFGAVLLVHNTFAAMQDVAIDALACNTLREDERGLANGLMFAGASIGQVVGGSGVLFIAAYTGLAPTYFFVALAILAVTCLVVLPMKEEMIQAVAEHGRGLRDAAREMRQFAVDSFRSFLHTRGAFAGVGFSLLPAGAMALGLALRSNLSVELGLDETETAQLEFWANVIAAAAMVLGGWLSDKLGRRRTLFVYLALMSLPTVWLAWRLQQLGYVMPRATEGGVLRDPALAAALWTATLVYNIFLGLMYGTRSAIMMDVTNPKVAATQFTAYMAMANLAIAYSATWQGVAVEAFGYPTTLLVDAILGVLNLLLIVPLKRTHGDESPGAPARRARWTAGVLSVICLAWIPFMLDPELLGAARPIANTFFTLVFVAAALMLLAAAAMLPRSALTRIAPWIALALLAMYARRFFEAGPLLHSLLGLTALAGALALAGLARHEWNELR
jgi:PAT family beta-lactamase induction signal transducer AmpG